jgi:hypothetical protein
MKEEWKTEEEEGRPGDLYTWVYRQDGKGNRHYLTSATGRIQIDLAREVVKALNQYEEREKYGSAGGK